MKTMDLSHVAVISVDNTKTFEEKKLNELYVPDWENAAIATKKIIDFCSIYGAFLVNVFDKHPKWHISFASSYKNKKPFDFITLEEVEQRTEENNWLSSTAAFSVDQLKEYLLQSPNYINQVWPDHGKDWTDSVDLMEPLDKNMFHINLVKWDAVDKHPYSWFVGTWLNEELKKRNIEKVIVTWVATDYCSGQTAEESAERGYETFVVSDAVRWVNPESTNIMLDKFEKQHITYLTLEQLKNVFFDL